jgi:hypothetical protein
MELRSTVAVMDVLGGTKAVAAITGRKYTAAFNWRKQRKFPANTFRDLQKALAAKGHTAPDSLWGM